MLPKCDIIVINTPLTEKTKGLFDKAKISKLKKGVLIVNNARGAIMDTQAVVDGCSSGHIAVRIEDEKLKLVAEGCNPRVDKAKEFSGEISKAQHTMQSLDKTISNLEMELAAARVVQDSILTGIPISGDLSVTEPTKRRKYLMVININTAFSSRKRIDYVRATWMQQGEKLKKLEDEKGIIMRFVIGHSATSGGILDRAIEAEEHKHGDFLRPDHVEGYLELSTKTKIYFATVVALWDADFYVKVDDDVHVNIVFEEVQQWIWRIASCTA
ncbi:Hexosyltransferase [Heracleum sosnowskyi]|uniref:Hexosyltransferase n=1 Tax=Heracleum sosnowskyi TaxID=360622 RepID=A0AAD8ITQ9_9APIA|nr:Hexosyltransferase [Heracleum sosnowskyi]